ncbi:MAG: histidine kinase [Gammaproteobacteria bacterium]|nr:histidine kinase [Gammaproteobacteria bacterium]MDH5729266.1 histidine kinase [Gammaproteobacteria bacterium]
MVDMFIIAFERLAIIICVVFLITRIGWFQALIQGRSKHHLHVLYAACLFGTFAIFSTYSGISYDSESQTYQYWQTNLGENEAIINSRTVAVAAAGFLAGVPVGVGAGVIAAIHRYNLDGFTALACSIATVISGLIAGLFHRFRGSNATRNITIGLLLGFVLEAMQMGIILLVASPFKNALELVQAIAFPMIISNAIGCAIFMWVFELVYRDRFLRDMAQTQKALKFVGASLQQDSILEDQNTRLKVAETIRQNIGADEVDIRIANHSDASITPTVRNGAHRISTKITCCSEPVANLDVYFKNSSSINSVTQLLIDNIAQVLSQYLDIQESQKQQHLAKSAEVNALHAQLYPHFLGNAFVTIINTLRKDTEEARKLLENLAHFYNENLNATVHRRYIKLDEELNHIQSYLAIQQARFGSRLKIHYQIDTGTQHHLIPPITLLPLVENAIRHNTSSCKRLEIEIHRQECGVFISIHDNGTPINAVIKRNLGLAHIQSQTDSGHGIGVYTVNQRLVSLFGIESKLQYSSTPNGNRVSFILPAISIEEDYDATNQSAHC